ncbi:MAG TPA: flagellar hook-length control protein FliK [Burkholderiales bacterium]|nr:flagellar hook-length control protein FliK [Burkholderiales bacterium]
MPGVSLASLISNLEVAGQAQPKGLPQGFEAILSYLKGNAGVKVPLPAYFTQILSDLMKTSSGSVQDQADQVNVKVNDSLSVGPPNKKNNPDSKMLIASLQALMQQFPGMAQAVYGVNLPSQVQTAQMVASGSDGVLTKGSPSPSVQQPLSQSLTIDQSGFTHPKGGQEALKTGIQGNFQNQASPVPVSATQSTIMTPPANLADFRQFLPQMKAHVSSSSTNSLQGWTSVSPSFSATSQSPLPVHQVNAVVNTPSWPDSFAQKVVLLVGQQTHVASLHLNPPELGPIQVHLSVHHGEVNAVFLSHQAGVRDAIEAALPKLRAQMDASGMTLGQTQVSSDNAGRQQGQSQGSYVMPSVLKNNGVGVDAGNVFALTLAGLGNIDMFV